MNWLEHLLNNIYISYDIALEVGAIDPPRREGSKRGKRWNIAQERIEGHERLVKNYFVEDPIYDAKMSCRLFKLWKRLFSKTIECVQNYDLYFVQKPYATS